MKHIFRTGCRFFSRIPKRLHAQKKDAAGTDNPYLPWIREIVEEILREKKMGYDAFFPMLIDGGDSEACLSAAAVLAEGLNHLVIITDHPEYFQECADTMYEEYGLIAEIFSKIQKNSQENVKEAVLGSRNINVILDFEKPEESQEEICFGKRLYIPIFKKAWENSGNLDIAVPIGYNTVIVKGSKIMKKQPHFDRLERAFYENK